MLRVTPNISIGEGEVRQEFVRSSGPGGQNVNKVSTAVRLRFDVLASPMLPADVKGRLLRLAGRRATREGVLVIEGQRFRTQARNRRDAMDRLLDLLRRAAERPRPRKPTAPTFASRQRRREAKRLRSRTKGLRRQSAES